MPTIWLVKDGPRGNTTDVGTEISFDEIERAFKAFTIEYLSERPPAFNTDSPSQYYEHVVIEVTEDDGIKPTFPNVGFYIVSDLSPQQAHVLLQS